MSFYLLLSLMAAMTSALLTVDQKHEFIGLHNRLRSEVGPVAADMLGMQWDRQLETSAQARAEACPTAHGYPNADQGENIAWGWPTMTTTQAFKKWSDEKNDYSPEMNICSGSKQCGHYIQLINSNSSRIGCGYFECPGLFGQQKVQTYVCHYKSAGNLPNMPPYKKGASCSICPPNFTCHERLCIESSTTPLSLFPDLHTPTKSETNNTTMQATPASTYAAFTPAPTSAAPSPALAADSPGFHNPATFLTFPPPSRNPDVYAVRDALTSMRSGAAPPSMQGAASRPVTIPTTTVPAAAAPFPDVAASPAMQGMTSPAMQGVASPSVLGAASPSIQGVASPSMLGAVSQPVSIPTATVPAFTDAVPSHVGGLRYAGNATVAPVGAAWAAGPQSIDKPLASMQFSSSAPAVVTNPASLPGAQMILSTAPTVPLVKEEPIQTWIRGIGVIRPPENQIVNDPSFGAFPLANLHANDTISNSSCQ